jgi:lipopolysaccharide/colanic/teichoic acid biosynthesis glycosyltransferase
MTGLAAVLKRVFDFVVAALLSIAAAPILAIIAILVKRSSPGPVFFKQERVGKGGRQFHIYKFRTMYQDADQILKSDAQLYRTYVENNYKLPKGQDPRVTFIGRILRELSLDELPQLINVIKRLADAAI